MNEDVHTDELLDHYNYALVELYKHVPLLNLPDLSRIAHRFGARCGENLTDEERAERKVCSPSADMKEAWRAYHADEELTPEQCRLVRHAAAVIEAWRAKKNDNATQEQLDFLKDKNIQAWLTFEAWNDYHAHGGDMSQLSPEQQELLRNSYFWKVHVAWKEYHANGGDITKLSKEDQELLLNCHGWKVREAWNDYHLNGGDMSKLSDEKQELLANNLPWKVREAWKEYHANGGHITKLSDEKQNLLTSCYSWKLHVAWKEYHANGGDITKLSDKKQDLLKNSYSWNLHDKAFVKHVKTIEDLKKDDSNYVQVRGEEVFFIPEYEMAAYYYVKKLRLIKEGDKDDWMRQKFEQAAGISLSKMEEAYSQLRDEKIKAAAEKKRLEEERTRVITERITERKRREAAEKKRLEEERTRLITERIAERKRREAAEKNLFFSSLGCPHCPYVKGSRRTQECKRHAEGKKGSRSGGCCSRHGCSGCTWWL